MFIQRTVAKRTKGRGTKRARKQKSRTRVIIHAGEKGKRERETRSGTEKRGSEQRGREQRGGRETREK